MCQPAGVKLNQSRADAGSLSPPAVQMLAASGARVVARAWWPGTRKLAAAPVRAPGAHWHRTVLFLPTS